MCCRRSSFIDVPYSDLSSSFSTAFAKEQKTLFTRPRTSGRGALQFRSRISFSTSAVGAVPAYLQHNSSEVSLLLDRWDPSTVLPGSDVSHIVPSPAGLDARGSNPCAHVKGRLLSFQVGMLPLFCCCPNFEGKKDTFASLHVSTAIRGTTRHRL